MRRSSRKIITVVLAIITLLASASCASLTASRSQHHATSVVEYLYPDKDKPVETPTVPVLKLPLAVGVAFVPASVTSRGSLALDEARKAALLERVSAEFRQYPFIRSIEVIPSAYLRPRGSFANLDQIRTMYGVDVIALVSYDQTQFTDERQSSIFYWTLVGAYLVKGDKNDTSTMLDAAVYDIASRKMLFRAPGLSQVKATTTLVSLAEQQRTDSVQGFDLAAQDLIVNLQQQLDAFKEKVKQSPQQYQVVRSSGYSGGGGALPLEMLAWLGVLVALRVTPRKRKRV